MVGLQDIYNKSPITLQNIMVSSSGVLKARQRYGKIYAQRRRWLLEYDEWPLDAKLKHQSNVLQNFIGFANDNSTFYQHLYAGIDTGDLQNPEDLRALPIVDKEMLRSNIQRVYTVGKRESSQGETGGTTGKPLTVRYTFADSMRRMALLDHFKSRHGFENRRMLKATFSGKSLVPPGQRKDIYWRYNHAAKQMLYSTFHLSDKNLEYYVRHLNKVKPKALDGFVTSLTDIANFIERNDITLDFQPIAIFPTAETVTDSTRALLERVFNCKVYDQYASSEGAPFLTECTHGSMHMELSSGVFENLPGSEEILVTSFQTKGTPLIRYRIGDSMSLNMDGGCSCGVDGPLVKTIYGRSGDYLLRPDGAKINSGHVSNLFKNLPGVVVQAQVIQKEIDKLEVLLVTDDRDRESQIETMLQHEILSAFGSAMKARISYVDYIPRAASGKHRLVRNLLANT